MTNNLLTIFNQIISIGHSLIGIVHLSPVSTSDDAIETPKELINVYQFDCKK